MGEHANRVRAVADDEFDAYLAESRRRLLSLDQTSTGALLEPRRGTQAIELAMVMAAGTHEVEALIAVSTVLTSSGDESGLDVLSRARLQQTAEAFDDAVAAYENGTGPWCAARDSNPEPAD